MNTQPSMPTQLPFLDTTTYKHHFSDTLNTLLFNFTGSECLMVRRINAKQDTRKITKTAGHCHKNVAKCVKQYGGHSVSGWLLDYNRSNIDRKIYIWNFHSVWEQKNGKLLDVTENQRYGDSDQSIFIPDMNRAPDLQNGTSYNNFIVIDNWLSAYYYNESIKSNVTVSQSELYWCNHDVNRVMPIHRHSGQYKLVNQCYPQNRASLCNDYNVKIVNDKLYPIEKGLPISTRVFFDYSIGSL